MTRTTIFRLRFNRNYTTFVKTSHGIVKADFTPIVLFGRTENSQFGTADPEVVEGLKRHRDFGSLFFIEEEGMPVSPEEEAAAAPAPAGAAAEAGTEATGTATATETDKEEAGSSEPGAAAEAGTEATETATATETDKEEAGSEPGAAAEAGTEATGTATATETNKEEAGSEPGAEDNLMHEKSVTSKNKAIAYLLEKHGAAFTQTADIAAMKEEARSVYNLVFDNWE